MLFDERKPHEVVNALLKRVEDLVKKLKPLKANDEEKKDGVTVIGAKLVRRKFGPKSANHPSVGESCLACGASFRAGDFTTLIELGPGDGSEARRMAREGKAYKRVDVEVHYACATGHDE